MTSFTADLLVNGNADTADTLYVTDPAGTQHLLSYSSPATIDGITCSSYGASVSSALPTNGNYNLTVQTASAGTATASVPAISSTFNDASGGSSASWTGSGMFNYVLVLDSSNSVTTFVTSNCTSASSPVAIPSSAYPFTATTYDIATALVNYTRTINSGQGLFGYVDIFVTDVTK